MSVKLLKFLKEVAYAYQKYSNIVKYYYSLKYSFLF